MRNNDSRQYLQFPDIGVLPFVKNAFPNTVLLLFVKCNFCEILFALLSVRGAFWVCEFREVSGPRGNTQQTNKNDTFVLE